jgi:hypothetical protein
VNFLLPEMFFKNDVVGNDRFRGINIYESVTTAFHTWCGGITNVVEKIGRNMIYTLRLLSYVWSAAQWRILEPAAGCKSVWEYNKMLHVSSTCAGQASHATSHRIVGGDVHPFVRPVAAKGAHILLCCCCWRVYFCSQCLYSVLKSQDQNSQNL